MAGRGEWGRVALVLAAVAGCSTGSKAAAPLQTAETQTGSPVVVTGSPSPAASPRPSPSATSTLAERLVPECRHGGPWAPCTALVNGATLDFHTLSAGVRVAVVTSPDHLRTVVVLHRAGHVIDRDVLEDAYTVYPPDGLRPVDASGVLHLGFVGNTAKSLGSWFVGPTSLIRFVDGEALGGDARFRGDLGTEWVDVNHDGRYEARVSGHRMSVTPPTSWTRVYVRDGNHYRLAACQVDGRAGDCSRIPET